MIEHILNTNYTQICRCAIIYKSKMKYSQVAPVVKPACQFRRPKRRGFDPWVGNICWRKAWQPTPVFFLGESHGQRSLAGYSQ